MEGDRGKALELLPTIRQPGLAQDDPKQSPRATEIIERRLTEQEPGFVSLVTILDSCLGSQESFQAH
jgi:hypothetical protein